MGMSAFQQALGLPVQLYAPYFCNDTAYLSNFSLVRSDASLSPDCFDFVSVAGGLVLLCVSHDAYSNSGLSCVYLGCRRVIVVPRRRIDPLQDFYDPAPESAVAFYEFLYDLGQSYGMFSYEPGT